MNIQQGTPVDSPIIAGRDNLDDIASAIGSQIRGNFQKFDTIKERDLWTTHYSSRLYGTTCFVKNGEDGDPTWYEWTGVKDDGTDGKWQVLEIIPAIAEHLMSFENMNGQNGSKGTGITLIPPLQGYPDPDSQQYRVELQHGVLAPMPTPNYLAYLSNDVQVLGKEDTDTKYHDGTLWFDNAITPKGPYISIDRATKKYGIQEPDEKDPNVTGGTNYLIAVRISLKGIAPEDGMVRLVLKDSSGIMIDINEGYMAMERQYKKGDELEFIEVVGVVNAKGLNEFTVHAITDFDTGIYISSLEDGISGIMIQALTDKGKSSESLRQYEMDTNQVIRFKTKYFGKSLFDIRWVTQKDQPMTRSAAGTGLTMNSGIHFYNTTPLKVGIQDSQLVIQDNGKDMCYFSFGKIFSAEDTVALHNRDVVVPLTLTNEHCAVNVALLKWTGSPNKFTSKVIAGVNNMQPILEKGWEIVKHQQLDEKVGEHDEQVSFTIPTDAQNFAILIYPSECQQPCGIKLKKFDIDVKEPFMGAVVKAPSLDKELHLHKSTQYIKVVEDSLGYASLRYTLTEDILPMPCGLIKTGKADITIDPTKNVVPNTEVHRGEGAIAFNKDGLYTIKSTVHVYPGNLLPKGDKATARFYWCRLGKNDFENKIPESEFKTIVTGEGNPVFASSPEFKLQIKAGEQIVFKGITDKTNYAYISCADDSKPMLSTEITFEEIVADNYPTYDPSLVYDSGVREQ